MKDMNDGKNRNDERNVTVAESTTVEPPVGTERGIENRRSHIEKGFGAMTKKRWGKVASLAVEVRDWINAQIRDGVKYQAIVDGLEQKGVL